MAAVRAFTTIHGGISNVLHNEVEIGTAFDPATEPAPSLFSFKAIWDTGATHSVVTEDVALKVGLAPTGVALVHGVQGSAHSAKYLLSLKLPNGVWFPAMTVTEGDLLGADVLIGMDVIASGDFAVSNFGGKTVMTYRVPSVETIDFVKDVRNTAKRTRKPSRSAKRRAAKQPGGNTQCHCGSGLKLRNCCGK